MYQPAIGRSSHISAKRFYSNEFITNLFETTIVLLTGIPLLPESAERFFPDKFVEGTKEDWELGYKIMRESGDRRARVCPSSDQVCYCYHEIFFVSKHQELPCSPSHSIGISFTYCVVFWRSCSVNIKGRRKYSMLFCQKY